MFYSHRHFRFKIYVAEHIFYVITPNLLFQLLIVLVWLTSIPAGLWLPSVPSLGKMCLCVFIDDRSLDLALFAVAGRHMGTFLCPCWRTKHASFFKKPLSLAHHGQDFGFLYVTKYTQLRRGCMCWTSEIIIIGWCHSDVIGDSLYLDLRLKHFDKGPVLQKGF